MSTEASGAGSTPVIDVVVVTGASGGFGRGISEAVSHLSEITVLVGRDARSLKTVATRCSGDVKCVVADVNVAPQIDQLRDLLEEISPRRIAVVTAAGVIGPIALPGTEDPASWGSAMETNLMGTYRTVHPCLPIMRENNWGRVIMVSSAQTLHGPDPVMTSYTTAKLAVNAYAACLASHFEGTEISVCAIHPGDAYTGMGEEIERKASAVGPSASHLTQWARRAALDKGSHVDEAGNLVTDILIRPASWSNGRFLMVPSSIDHHPSSGWAMDVGHRQ